MGIAEKYMCNVLHMALLFCKGVLTPPPQAPNRQILVKGITWNKWEPTADHAYGILV